MTEQQLRALVREAIARHLEGDAGSEPSPFSAVRLHASHGMVPLSSGSDADGPCLIEPAVACNHCGYCKSLGH